MARRGGRKRTGRPPRPTRPPGQAPTTTAGPPFAEPLVSGPSHGSSSSSSAAMVRAGALTAVALADDGADPSRSATGLTGSVSGSAVASGPPSCGAGGITVTATRSDTGWPAYTGRNYGAALRLVPGIMVFEAPGDRVVLPTADSRQTAHRPSASSCRDLDLAAPGSVALAWSGPALSTPITTLTPPQPAGASTPSGDGSSAVFIEAHSGPSRAAVRPPIRRTSVATVARRP